jgi:hypothetical protein
MDAGPLCQPRRGLARLPRNLDGLHDDLPADAFYFTGGIEDIRKGGAPGAVV